MPDLQRTPSEMLDIYVDITGKDLTPITSIRRALTTLQQEGYLIRLETKRMSQFNRPEYVYALDKERYLKG